MNTDILHIDIPDIGVVQSIVLLNYNNDIKCGQAINTHRLKEFTKLTRMNLVEVKHYIIQIPDNRERIIYNQADYYITELTIE